VSTLGNPNGIASESPRLLYSATLGLRVVRSATTLSGLWQQTLAKKTYGIRAEIGAVATSTGCGNRLRHSRLLCSAILGTAAERVATLKGLCLLIA